MSLPTLRYTKAGHPNAHKALFRFLVSPVGVFMYSSSVFVKFAHTGPFLGGLAVRLQGHFILI